MGLEETPKETIIGDESNLISSDPFCGIVLAGGEGERLRPFVHLLRKDLLPKQYVNFIGRRSMLEHTLHRAEKLIPSERLFIVLNEAHLGFPEVKQQICKRPRGTIIVQPENKETGPGLLLPLMHLFARYPNSVVAIFPSDHFVLEEEELMRYVQLGHRVVKNDPTRLVLLGIEPDREESEYGYILPEKTLDRAPGPFPVSCFIEKPDLKKARDLIHSGALWNTMMMIFRIETVLRLVYEVAPNLYLTFQQIYNAIETPLEDSVVWDIYQRLKPVNFSKQLLEPYVQAHPSSLLAIRVRGVLWSDWGTESRVMEILRRTGHVARLNGLSPAPPLTIQVKPEQKDIQAKPQTPRAKHSSATSKQRTMSVVSRALS